MFGVWEFVGFIAANHRELLASLRGRNEIFAFCCSVIRLKILDFNTEIGKFYFGGSR